MPDDPAGSEKMTQIEFLKQNIANARRVLALPSERYPNGRMSHDVMTECLARWVEELEDARLDNGYCLGRDGRLHPADLCGY